MCGAGICVGINSADMYVCVKRVGELVESRFRERKRERERERCPGLLLVGVVPDLTEGVHSIFYGGQPPRSGMLLAGYTHWR